MDVINTPVIDRAVPAVPDSRWIGVGASSDKDSRQAGLAAATTALRGDEPKLLVVFASPAHDLAAMLAGIRDRSPRRHR